MKVIKLEFTCEDENGKLYSRTLLNEKDIELWQEYMLGVCQFASLYKINPNWEDLKWQVREIKPKNRNKKLLESIIDNS